MDGVEGIKFESIEYIYVQNLFIKHEVRVHPSDIAVHRGIYDCTEIDINTLLGVTMVTL